MTLDKKKRMALPSKVGIAGLLVCISGASLGWGVLPSIVKNQITQGKSLAPGTDNRQLWEKLPFPMIYKMHVFNVTNYRDVTAGAVPILNEIGPYYFDEWKEKVELVDDEVEDTVTFYMKNTWIFNKEKSWPLNGDEIVYIPHPALLGTLLTTERDMPAFLGLVAQALPGVFTRPNDVFLRTRVMDLLFNGHFLNCTSKSLPVIAVCAILRTKGFEKAGPNLLKFSLFGQKNGTKDPAEYRVSRGTRDIQTVGQMVAFKGRAKQTAWSSGACNSIAGTDGTVFPPFITKQVLRTFSIDVCRSMILTFKNNSMYKGIPTLHYESSYGDMSVNPDEACFCQTPRKCMKQGVMDLHTCQGSPLVASMPHFYDAHEDYQQGVQGLNPDPTKHVVALDFEPFAVIPVKYGRLHWKTAGFPQSCNGGLVAGSLTGTPLVAKVKLQLSLPMHKIAHISMTKNLKETIVPFIWVEEGIELSDEVLEELDSKLFSVLRTIDIGKWVLAGGGAGAAIIGAGLKFKNRKVVKPTLDLII